MPTITELRKICQKSVPELDKYPLLFKAIRVVSIYLTWILIKTPLTPNSITILGIFSACLGLFSFIFGWPILGIVFFIFCIISDFSDGEVSRYKNLRSKEGTYLDKVHHLYSNCIFFIALTLLFFNQTSDITFLYAGLIIIPFSILLPFTVTYAIDVAVLTHIRYYAENSKRFILTGIEKEKDNAVDVNPNNRMIIKILGGVLRELVNLSRYWGFPHVYCVFGIIAVIEVMFLDNTHALTRFVFIFYAFSYPLWTIAFLSRVLGNRIIEREVELLIEKFRLRSNQ
jgi:phosphatidylglycerophosphate synthase